MTLLHANYTGCPTRCQNRHEDTATKFQQEYVRCVRNEEECVCSAPNCCDTEQRSASNILISGKTIKEMPGSVASGTHCTTGMFGNLVIRNVQRILVLIHNFSIYTDFYFKIHDFVKNTKIR